MPDTANEELLDGYASHAIYVNRLASGLANDMDKHLDKILASYTSLLYDAGEVSDKTDDEVNELLGKIYNEINKGYVKSFADHQESLNDLADYETDFKDALLASVLIPLLLKPNRYTKVQLTKLKRRLKTEPLKYHDDENNSRTLKEWRNSLAKDERRIIREAIRDGVKNGLTNRQIMKRYRDSKTYEGQRRDVETTTKTSTLYYASQSSQDIELNNIKYIKAYRWLSVIDRRTTPRCRALQGQVWIEGEVPARPPIHQRCRSVLVPVLRSAEAMGVKRNKVGALAYDKFMGEIPAEPDLTAQYRKQARSVAGREQVDKILGKKYAAAVVDGVYNPATKKRVKLSLDEFVGSDFEQLTLKQVMENEGLVFKKPK